MFDKFKSLKHSLLSRISGKPATKAAVVISYGQNNADDLATDEFRRQFLIIMSKAQGDIMLTESYCITCLWKMNVITVPLFAVAAAVNLPVAFGAVLIANLYGAFKVAPEVFMALEKASEEVTKQLHSGNPTNLQSVEKWLRRHKDKLSVYLDKRERHHEEYLRLIALIKRINNQGNPDALKESDRVFLKDRGYKKLKPPIKLPREYPAASFLSLYHHTQLSRALYHDIYRQAGADGSVIRRAFSLRANNPTNTP